MALRQTADSAARLPTSSRGSGPAPAAGHVLEPEPDCRRHGGRQLSRCRHRRELPRSGVQDRVSSFVSALRATADIAAAGRLWDLLKGLRTQGGADRTVSAGGYRVLSTQPSTLKEDPMTDPRAFTSFDFDNNEKQKDLFVGQARSDSPTPLSSTTGLARPRCRRRNGRSSSKAR